MFSEGGVALVSSGFGGCIVINGLWQFTLDVIVTNVYNSRQNKNYLVIYHGASVMTEMVNILNLFKKQPISTPASCDDLYRKRIVVVPVWYLCFIFYLDVITDS